MLFRIFFKSFPNWQNSFYLKKANLTCVEENFDHIPVVLMFPEAIIEAKQYFLTTVNILC